MLNNSLISIIVPIYNNEDFLPKCINSILKQTFTEYELLLIDDGSNDSSGKICDEFAKNDDRINVFHKKNEGVSSARNIGLDNAKGEWITFVDCDDWVAINFLEIMLRKARDNNVDAVFCNCFYAYKKKIITRPVYNEEIIINGTEIVRRLLKSHHMRSEIWGKIIKKDIIGKKRFNTNLKIGEDLIYLLELFNDCNCRILNTTLSLYYYYQSNTSAMRSANFIEHKKSLLIEYLQFKKCHSYIEINYSVESATFIVRTILSFVRKDIVMQSNDSIIMNLLKRILKTRITICLETKKDLLKFFIFILYYV